MTLRNETIKKIKVVVVDDRFSSEHEAIEKYSDEMVQNFMLVALARRKKINNKPVIFVNY